MPSRRKAFTKGAKIIDSLPSDLRSPLKAEKLAELTFSDFNTVGKQLQKYFARDPAKFTIDSGDVFCGCGGCFCFCG